MPTEDIGDLSVDVIADMDGFEERLRARLKRITDKVRANIQATLDTSIAERQAKVFRSIAGRTVEMTVSVSQRSQASIAAFAANVSRELRTAVQLPALTLQLARASIPDIKAKIATIPGVARDIVADIALSVKTAVASAEVQGWLLKQRAKAIEISVKVSKASLANAAAQLKGFTGLTSLTNEVTKFNDKIKGFFSNLPGIARATTLFTSFGAVGVHAIGALLVSIASLGPALQGLGAAALAIPGVLAGIAAGAAVVITAFKNAPDVVKEAAGSFAGLKDIIVGNFWGPAAESTSAFLTQLGAQVKTGFAGVATAVGGVVNRLATSLKSVFTDDVTAGLFANIQAGADALAPAMAPLANILKTLLQFGTSLLPGIADWLVKIGTQFDAWLQKAFETGRLNEMLSNLGTFLQAAWSAASALVSIIGGLATAAANAGIGGLFAGLQQIADIINSPAFQSTLTMFFAGVAEGSRGLLSALGPIGDMLTALMPILSTFIADAGGLLGEVFTKLADALSQPVFKEGLSSFFAGILDFIRPLLPVLPDLVAKFADLGSLAGTILTQLGPVLATGISALLPVFGALLDAVDPIVKILGPILSTVIKALAPVLQTIVTGLEPIIAVAGKLLPIIGKVVTSLLSGLGPAFDMLMPIIGELVEALFAIIEPILNALMPILGPLVQLLGVLLNVGLQPLLTILQLLGPVFQVLGLIMQTQMEIIGAVIETIVALFSGDFTKVGEIWSGLFASFPQPVQDFIISTVGMLTDFVTNTIGMFSDFFTSTVGMFHDFFFNIGFAIGSWVISTVGMFTDFFTNTVGMFRDFGTNIGTAWNNLWAGVGEIVKGAFNGVLGFIENGVNGAIGLINGMIGSINGISSAVGIPAIPSIPSVSLPRLASGATILPKRGGTAAILGEGGRSESVVDTGLLNRLLAQVTNAFPRAVSAMRNTMIGAAGLTGMPGGNSTTNNTTNNFPVPLGTDPAEVAQEFVNRATEKAGL